MGMSQTIIKLISKNKSRRSYGGKELVKRIIIPGFCMVPALELFHLINMGCFIFASFDLWFSSQMVGGIYSPVLAQEKGVPTVPSR